MGFQKILCPVDFSETSRRAMERAADLARSDGAVLTLMHVLAPGSAGSNGTRPIFPVGVPFRSGSGDAGGGATDHAERILEDWRATLATQGIRCGETTLLPGDAATEILRLASDGQYDLIVLGTHGKTGVLGALLGNVSYKVVRTAACSVLTVRDPASPR